MAKLDGIAVSAVGAGIVLLWSGIQNRSITYTLQSLVRGVKPTPGPAAPLVIPATGVTTTSVPVSAVSTSVIASNAMAYVGKLRYVYGGPPPAGTVDCSSFASKVLAESAIPNPGGSPFNPNAHGPSTLHYIAWSGAQTVGHSASVAEPGDLVVWQTHMGIAIGNGQMVSARDPAQGVGVDNIAGDMPGELMFIRRIVLGNPHA